jgi:hypothetical protein
MQMENSAKRQIVNDLIAEQVDAQTAERLADEVPEVCRRQLSYLDYQDDQEDRAAMLVASIEGDWPEPSNSYWANVARQYSADAALAPDADMARKEAAPFKHRVQAIYKAVKRVNLTSHQISLQKLMRRSARCSLRWKSLPRCSTLIVKLRLRPARFVSLGTLLKSGRTSKD